MTTTGLVSWTITAIGSDTVVGTAEAADPTAAWTAALRAARVALLTGELDTVAVTIADNPCGALYNPARDEHGRINPTALTTALLDLHHAATVGELAHVLSDERTDWCRAHRR